MRGKNKEEERLSTEMTRAMRLRLCFEPVDHLAIEICKIFLSMEF